MRATLPAGGCRASLVTVAYPSLAENDVHASAMSALVNRTMSPLLQFDVLIELEYARRRRPAPALALRPSITGKTYVNLNDRSRPRTIRPPAPEIVFSARGGSHGWVGVATAE